VEDKHTYGKKMARKGRTKVIYKGTFVSIQTLLSKIEGIDTFKATNFHQNAVKTYLKSITIIMHYIR
jgi:hypothetical protein